MNIVAGISVALTLFAGVIAFDTRYTKQTAFETSMKSVQLEFIDTLEDVKTDIIDEMRREVVRNRTVMLGNMQREADNLEWQILELEGADKPVPRYMSEKFKEITRQIEALQDNEITN